MPGPGGVIFAGVDSVLDLPAEQNTAARPIRGLVPTDRIDIAGTGAPLNASVQVDDNGFATIHTTTGVTALNLPDRADQTLLVASDNNGGILVTLQVTMQLARDTGSSPFDNFTSDPTVTGTAAPNANLLMSIDGVGALAIKADATGQWTYKPTLADGGHTLGVTQVDTAGQIAGATLGFTLEGPPAAPTIAGISGELIGPDTSYSGVVTIRGTVGGQDGPVILNDNGTPFAQLNSSHGNWSLQLFPLVPLSRGDHVFTAVAGDPLAGTASAVSNSVTVHVVASPATPAAPTLAHDTGTSNSDDITRDPTIVYPTPTASDVLLYSTDGTNFSTTAPSFAADGQYTVSIEQRDAFRTVSAPSGLTFSLDTTPPAAPAAPTLTHDTGASSSDNITNNATITYPTPAPGDVLLYSVDGVNFSTAAPFFLNAGQYTVSIEERDSAGNDSAAASLSFTYDPFRPATPAAPTLAHDTGTVGDNITNDPTITYPTPAPGDDLLYSLDGVNFSTSAPSFAADGLYTIRIKERDVAGNVTGPSSLSFSLDTTAPAKPAAPILTHDTGIVGDNITSDPTITYPTPASGDVLLYSLDGVNFLASAPSFAADGPYTVSVEERDTAGNTSAPASLTFTLQAPMVNTPAAPTLLHDTGASSTDKITSDPTISYPAPDAGDVLLYSLDGTNFSTTAPTFTIDGQYTVSIKQRDGSNNLSAASSLTFTLDKTAPAAPLAPVLAHDTGLSATDKITNDPTITYPTAAAGTVLVYSLDGVNFSATAPTFAIDGTADGQHTVTIKQRDTAGNDSAAASLSFTLDTTAPAVPAAPVLAQDTGDSNTDNLTRIGTVTYPTPAAGDVLLYSTDGTTFTTTAPTFTTDGPHSVQIQEEDTAGNIASDTGGHVVASPKLNFILDTTAPATPAAPVLFNDTGTVGDGITSDPTITYPGVGADETLLFSLDGVNFSTTQPTFTIDGPYTVSIKVRDAAGNIGTASSLSFTLDTTPPTAPAAPVLLHDTGASNSDKITSDATITYPAPTSGNVLVYSLDGVNFSTTVPSFAADGQYTVSIKERDAAGNDSAAATLSFTLDRIPPTTPAAPVLAHDTGTVGDKITNDPTITYPTPAAGDVLLYSLDGVNFSTTAPTFSTDGTADGQHTVSIKERDAAGNTSGQASSLTFTLNTSAVATPAAPALANDTGASGDGITSDPTINYPAAGTGLTLIYSLDGASFSTTAPTVFADGQHTVSIKQQDGAGNTSGPASVTFTLDTTEPTTPAAPTLLHDTGFSSTDHLTNDATVTYPTPAAGDVLLYSLDGVNFSTTAPTFAADGQYTVSIAERDTAGNVSGVSSLTFRLDTLAPATPAAPVLTHDTGASSTDKITNDATITYPGATGGDVMLFSLDGGAFTTAAPTIPINDASTGQHTIAIKESDLAGNMSAASSLTFTADFTAPARPAAPVLANDTGTAGDNITSDPTITYPAPATGDVLLYSLDGTNFSTTAPIFSADGQYTLSIKERDTAGNLSTASNLAFTLNTAAVPKPAAPVLVHDTGLSASDDITSDAAITYPTAPAGTVLIYSLDGINFSTTAPTFAADGQYTVTIKQRDAAFNLSAAASLTFTLDTQAPGKPAAPTLPLFDGTTSNPTITYPTPAAGDILIYSLDSVNFSTTAPTFSVDGQYTVTIRERDAAGNTSSPSSVTFTRDTTAPLAPSAPALTAASDSGKSQSDNITNVSAPTFTGTAEARAAVILFDGSTQIGQGQADTHGSWSIISGVLADGVHGITAKAMDAASNLGVASTATMITIDTTPPAAPVVKLANDTGVSSTDKLTNDPTLTVLASTPSYQVDGGSVSSALPVFAIDGRADGQHTVTVTDTDTAGNTSSTSLTFTLDTQPPIANNAAASANAGIFVVGFLSASDHLGLPLSYSVVSGPAHGSVAVSPDGRYSYTSDPTFGGTDSFTFRANDGVLSSNAATVSFNVVDPHLTGTSGDDSYNAPSGTEHINAGSGIDTVSFNFKLTDATIAFAGNQVIVDGPNGSSHTVLTGVEVYKFTDGTVNDSDGDPLVDDLFYYSQNHDVWLAGADADAHYHALGWHEGRDPDAFFSTSTYLSRHPDVRESGVDPLIQFDQGGWKTADPSIAFDTGAYLNANPDVKAAGVDPLLQFLSSGEGELRQPIAPLTLTATNGFDYVYYLQHNPDVAAAHIDPFLHYETVGWKEGRNPNAYFDVKGYLAHNPDVAAAGINPLDHYDQSGWKEGRDPSPNFDTKAYLAAYPDVAAAHIDPLAQFLAHGIYEGRTPHGDGVWG